MQSPALNFIPRGLYIGGEWVSPVDGRAFASINPTNMEKLADVPGAGEKDVDTAVKAAKTAFRQWSRVPIKERARCLEQLAHRIEKNADELALFDAVDSGNAIVGMRGDMIWTAEWLRYCAALISEIKGETFSQGDRHLNLTRRQPFGVVAKINPFNHPFRFCAEKAAAPLAAGNTVVIKGSEQAPLSSLRLGELCDGIFPPGVVNIVTGGPATGASLVAHPDVDKVAFTGSTEVGKEIRRAVAGTGKALTLELGGKAANIVFDDAALDQAVEGVVNGIYFNQGHVCCAGSRLFVQEPVVEQVLDKLKARLAMLRVGDPLDKNTDVGAINSRAQLDKITELVAAGAEEGGEVYQPPCPLPDRGYWFRPTVITGVTQSHRVAREEIFGPVLSVLTFRTAEEAVAKANNTRYGLSAGVWTEKGSKILWMSSRLKAGVVWANTYNRFDPASPFGGYKESGFGREGGVHGLAPYVHLEAARG